MTKRPSDSASSNRQPWGRLQFQVSIETSAGKATVSYDSADCKVTVEGPLFPTDLDLLNVFVQAARERKDRYPPARAGSMPEGLND
jgi:hypothetical protein